MYKTLLALCGAALMTAPSLHAQGARSFHGSTGGGSRSAFSSGGNRSALASSTGARSFNSGRSYANRGYRGNYYRGGRGGYYGGRYYGRRYYLGGIGYYYPYYGYGLGFGYPSYAYGGYWNGYGGAPYGYGYGDGGVYEGRVTDQGASAGREGQGEGSGASLPTAVQRQLAKRGYYKGSVDGDFGPASRSALSRFQRDNGVKATGRIDEDTLEKLGFSDRP